MAVDTPARHIYTGNGNQRVFPIPTKIIGDDYIRIEIDGIYQSDRTKWDIVNNSIIFITAPLNGKVIDVQVATSEEALTNLGSVSNVDIVASALTNVNTVANNIDEVVTVGTNIDIIISNNDNVVNIGIVADDITNVNTVATNINSVNTVSDNILDINTIALDKANIDIVASDLSNEYTFIEDNGVITEPVTNTVGISNITTVAENILNVNTVANNIDSINSVDSNATNINTVATDIVPNLTEILQADTNANNALTSANNALDSANDASASALSASTSAINASDSSLLASKWASENKNVIVEDGKYSAYHWAQTAADIVGSGLIDDTTPSTLKVYSSSKVTTSLPKVGFDTTNLVSTSAGQAAWNNTEATLDIGLNANVTLQVGQEELAYVKNSTGTTINNGKVVMAIGTNGASGNILVGLHDGTKANAKRIVGIATEDIINGSVGYITRNGKVRGINTSGSLYGETWVDGDIIYVKPNDNGGLTKIEPLDTQLKMPIAFVIKAHATNGTLYVRTTGIDENHDKEIIASKVPLTGDFSLDLGSII